MNSLLPKYTFNLEFSLVLGLINTKKTSGEKNTDRSKSAFVLSWPYTASRITTLIWVKARDKIQISPKWKTEDFFDKKLSG